MRGSLGLPGVAALVVGAVVGCDDETETGTETGTTVGTETGTGSGTGGGTSGGTATGTASSTGSGTGSGTGGGSTGGGGAGGGTPTGSGGNYPSPVAYWTLDSGDISGNTVVDSAGSADGTNHGASADASGQAGQALAFDGVDDFVSFGDVLENVVAGADAQFSASMWIKPATTLGGAGHFLLTKLGDASCTPDDDNRQWASLIATSPRFIIYGSLGQPVVIRSGTGTATPSTVGQWYHLVFVYDGTVDTAGVDRMAVYFDGVADPLTPSMIIGAFPFDIPANGAAPLAFGSRVSSAGTACNSSGATFFHGSLDELAIFDGLLTQQEVDAIRARGLAGQSL